MALPSLSSAALHLRLSIVIYLLVVASQFSLSAREAAISLRGVSEDRPILYFSTSPHEGFTCERIRVNGSSLLNLARYANRRHITLSVNGVEGKRFLGKVEVCFHRNVDMHFCGCEEDEWHSLHKGEWSVESSPYGNRFIDAKFEAYVPGIVTVSVEEGLQEWRLVCLVFVFILHLFAPLVSSWVPFYYTSSMVLGVVLLIVVSMYQGMNLLSMRKKNVLYVTLFGSLVSAAASFTLRWFTSLANCILVNFGIVTEIHMPVHVAFLVMIVLVGAGLGYWIVRKYVISEDGRVNTSVAQIVRWAMRSLAVVFVTQSTMDALLGWVAWCTFRFMCSLITSNSRHGDVNNEADTYSSTHSKADTSSRTHSKGSGRKGGRSSRMNSPVKPWRNESQPRRWSDGMIR